MAIELNISVYAARGLLKLSIKDELGPFYDLNKINYKLIKRVINNSLISRLKKLEIEKPEDILKIVLNKLAQNQSLLTFESI
ncbi:MAG: hypothetical protein ACFFAO_17250 [Candidatus Hermodarchaeota archaeon]